MDNKFIRILTLYKNDIYRFIYSYTKSKSDADDLTQNVFIKLYKRPYILDNSDEQIKKWLIKVALNECKTLFLSNWKKKILFIGEKEENIGINNKSEKELLEILFSLPKKYRTVLFLYYYEGYKTKEIAKILNITITNVQTILSRARSQLKKVLKEDNDE